MSNKLNIEQIGRKKSHKIFRADLTEDGHIKDLCKFLRKHKDKELDIIINGKKVSFKSITSRRKFASGFEIASNILFKQVEKFASEAFKKINTLTSELDLAKQKLQRERDAIKERNEELNIKLTTLELTKATWKERIFELEEACSKLKDEKEYLQRKFTSY